MLCSLFIAQNWSAAVIEAKCSSLGGCGQHQEERHLLASSLAPTPKAAQRLGVSRPQPWGYLLSS